MTMPVQPTERLPGQPEHADLFIDLTLPITRVGIGVFSFDPVEQAIGAPVAHILEPLMRGPVCRRPSAAGPAVNVYPLRLPEGEGLSVPLGQWGEIGFANRLGLLVLTVPWQAASWVQQRFGDAIVRGPREGVSSDGTARVAHFAIQLHAGMRAGIPLGMLGEVGVEAG